MAGKIGKPNSSFKFGRTLVTGGAGFIGSHLVARLLEEGNRVTVIDDLSEGKWENLPEHKNLKKIKASILDDLSKFVKGQDVIFHLAAIPRLRRSLDDPWETHMVNVDGTLNMLLLTKKYKVKRFIFASSSSVYGDQNKLPFTEDMKPNPLVPYALHKLIGEEYCKMKVLIAAPIHQSKDYSMDRWLENVSRQEHPADLLMVDNSPGTEYMKKVDMYCGNHGITNYKIIHLELPMEQGKHERVARAREIIRQYFLKHDYDAWFVWECDQIIPVNTLDNLIKIMKQENYLMVNPNKWAREDATVPNTDFGVCLIKREALEKHNFILEFNNPETPDTWETGEAWFKTQVLKSGGSYVDVYGVIDPIYHLNQ